MSRKYKVTTTFDLVDDEKEEALTLDEVKDMVNPDSLFLEGGFEVANSVVTVEEEIKE